MSKMKYRLYQMDTNAPLKFRDWDKETNTISLTEYQYKYVWHGVIECKSIVDALGKLWEMFNINHPLKYKGHSMSVSDLLVIEDVGYYVIGVGFKEMKIIDNGLENQTLKEFYTTKYNTDELGNELDENVTFKDLFNALDGYHDVYDLMGGADDSIIRERLFEQLAIIMNVDYDYIYTQWLK